MAKHFADVADIELLEIKDLPAFNEPEDKRRRGLSSLHLSMTIPFQHHYLLLLNGLPAQVAR